MSKLIRNMFIAALFAGAFALTASAADPAATTAAEPAAAPAAATKAAPPPKNTKAATAEAPKPAPEVKTTATVITNEGLSERCILSVVVTAVNGKEVTATDKTDTFEFAPGEHSISGHGGVDPTKCATFTGDNAVVLTEGEIIGQSTLKFTVVAGKTYYLGVDVRKPEKSTWKIVVWQIKH
jgi:nucleoid-associated protein YgaU